MTNPLQNTSFGHVLNRCVEDAQQDWLEQNQGHLDGDHAWTLEVVETALSAQLKHGGRCNVQVTVLAKKPWLTQTTLFRLKRHGPGDWIRERDTLNLYRK